ncbi:cytochrome P450 [Spirillospora albida]|uniref:cytochrome P450 n=1 Tax=Spirillospora albida TaxID=58123 RepID=UPI0004C1F4AE|nr:cytochrome P450 [Spirillospora albida]
MARGLSVPYDRLDRLRRRTPVVWLDGRSAGGAGAWAVLRYADVRHALAHPEMFAPEPDGILHGPSSGAAPAGGDAPLDMDPPAAALLSRIPDDTPVDFAQVAADLPETLRNTLAGGLAALLHHPGSYARLRAERADDRLLDSAVEEMLRWWTPVARVRRTVRRATALGRVPLLPGERVTLWLASANRDGDAFPEPGRFEPDRYLPGRGARPHVAFGYGSRACLGALLARTHLRAFLCALLDRPGRAVPAGEPVPARSGARNGFDRLPIGWTA